MNLIPGSYRARAIAPAEFGKSSQKETPGVAVMLRLEEGPNKGASIEWRAYLSDGAKPRTIEGLMLLGFDGEDPKSVMANEVVAVLDNESREYVNDAGEKKQITETRVKWINDPNRAQGAKFLPLDEKERAVIAGDIRAAVAAKRAESESFNHGANVQPQAAQANGPKPKF